MALQLARCVFVQGGVVGRLNNIDSQARPHTQTRMRSPIFQLIVCLLRYSVCVFIYIFVSSALCATQDADVHKAISFFLSLPFFFFFSLIRETLSALFNKKLFVVYIFQFFFSFFLFFPFVWTT